MQKLLMESQIILARLKAGSAFSEACNGFESQKTPIHLVNFWQSLINEVQNGRASATSSIEAFSDLVRLELYQQRELNKATRLPIVQSITLSIVTLLVAICSQFFFPENLKANLNELSISVLLILMGFGLFKFLIKRFKQKLWLAKWATFLKLTYYLMQQGQTLSVSINQIMKQNLFESFPASLKEQIHYIYSTLSNGLTLKDFQSNTKQDPKIQIALEQVKLISLLSERGQPVTETIQLFSESAQTIFEEDIENSSTAVAMIVLFPMFFCYAPALLILIFSPILRSLTTEH